MISEPTVRLSQTAHLSCVKISTISKRTQTSLNLSLVTLEYRRVRPKLFLSLVRSAQTVHIYCMDTNAVSKQIETRFHMTHSPRSSIGYVQHDFRADDTFESNRTPFLCEDYHYLQIDSKKLPLEPHHLGVSSGASKKNFEPMVRLAQTMHLYCTDINTVSK
jgi:hypothetical protein